MTEPFENLLTKIGPGGMKVKGPNALLPDYQNNVDRTPVGPCGANAGDNGALAYFRQMNPYAITSLSCQEAANNFTQAFNRRGVTYLAVHGHAAPGEIGCGGGQCPSYIQNLAVWNADYWQPFFAALEPLISAQGDQGFASDSPNQVGICLMGCQVGAEIEGLQLMQNILEITGAHEVWGPVCMVLAGPGSTWMDPPSVPQFVYRGAPQPSQPLPALGNDPTLQYDSRIVLRNDQNALSLDAEDIKSILVSRVSRTPDRNYSKTDLNRSDSIQLLQFCNFSEPTSFAGLPLAQHLGRIALELTSTQGKTITRQ